MLLSEALLLLLLDEEKGTDASLVIAADSGLAGALLLDLVAGGRLWDRGGSLVAVGQPPTEAAPAAAWRALSEEERSAKHWVAKLPGRLKPIKGTVASGLVERGVLDEQRHKRLGMFGTTRYRELDPGPEQELRARLRAVLVDGSEPDDATAALLGLLVPLDLVERVVARDERKAAAARAKAVAERGPVGDAVQAAVQEQIMAAVIASAATAAASGSTAFSH